MFDICNDILYSMIEASVTCIDTYYARARARRQPCTRTCAYISAHPHISLAHTPTNALMTTHAHAHMHAQVHAHVHACTHAHTHTNTKHVMRGHTHTFPRARATTQIHAYACRRAKIYTHTVTNMFARTHVRTQTRAHAHLGL